MIRRLKRIWCGLKGHRYVKVVVAESKRERIHRLRNVTICTRCKGQWDFEIGDVR